MSAARTNAGPGRKKTAGQSHGWRHGIGRKKDQDHEKIEEMFQRLTLIELWVNLANTCVNVWRSSTFWVIWDPFGEILLLV